LTLLSATCLVALWAHGRLHDRCAAYGTTVLGGGSQRLYDTARRSLNHDLAAVTMSYASVKEALDGGSPEEAVQILRLSCEVLDVTARSMQKMLDALGTQSRKLSTFVAVPAVDHGALRSPGLARGFAGVALLQNLLVSASERFRLRVFALTLGLSTLARHMGASTERFELEPDAGSSAWSEIRSLEADFTTLTLETIESVRLLLLSIDGSLAVGEGPGASALSGAG
jgi:hypothetical protein